MSMPMYVPKETRVQNTVRCISCRNFGVAGNIVNCWKFWLIFHKMSKYQHTFLKLFYYNKLSYEVRKVNSIGKSTHCWTIVALFA